MTGKALILVGMQSQFDTHGIFATEQTAVTLHKCLDFGASVRRHFTWIFASQDPVFNGWSRVGDPSAILTITDPIVDVIEPDAVFFPDPDQNDYSIYAGLDDFSRFRLEEFLSGEHIDRVYIGGIALENYVIDTALESIELGFPTTVLQDLSLSLSRSSADAARTRMLQAGVTLEDSADLLRSF